MIVERKTTKYGACNFCQRGKLNAAGAGIVYPYKEITFFTRESSGLAAMICDDCLKELFEKTNIHQHPDLMEG